MRLGAGSLFTALLASSVAFAGGRDASKAEAKGGGKGGLLGRAFQQAKRLGEAIDPDAVAQVEQAWNELAPDLRRAADDVIQAKTDLRAAGKEVGGIWSEVKQAVSGLGGEADGGTENITPSAHGSSADLGWEGLKKDAQSAVKGVLGDVFGEVADDILATFETSLAEALSEKNVRVASQLWRRLLDMPGLKLLAKERRLWAGAERVTRQYLSGYMSEESAMEAERAVNATADFALHFAGRSQNAGLTDEEVFKELSGKLCHLQGAAEKLWPLTVRALPFLGYEDYLASAERVIRSNTLSRITQTVSASALLGLNPRDPFLLSVIASFSLGYLTKDVAQNMIAAFHKVFLDQITFSQQTTGQSPFSSDAKGGAAPGGAAPLNAVDVVAELVSGKNTCQELGQQALTFFKMVQRALTESPLSANGGVHADTDGGRSGRSQETTASQDTNPHQVGSPRTPHPLKLDGILLQQAIWVAAVIDSEHFSLDVFVACLIAGSLFVSALVSTWLWRRCGRRNRAREGLKEASGVKLFGGPYKVSASAAKREKMA
ncbi:unnamed protein product [Scytosiphon promiscuus]